LKIIDFGKNTYQYEIDFRFDYITPSIIRRIVDDLYISKNRFSAVSKDASTNHTVLTQGQGSQESPVYELRIRGDKILLWTGWYVPYEKWQQWRSSIFEELQLSMSSEMVLACKSQCVFLIPADKLKRGDEIPEFAPARQIYARGVPEELLQRYNVNLAFGDDTGKEVLSFFIGSGQTPGEGSVTFNFWWNSFDKKAKLEEIMRAHASRSDGLLERFSSGLLSLLVKS
jgi:hypothetical protein